ncbi:glycosyltransferase family 2 protein [Scandinavium manionii]|uniref:glycosyltransferase family 2 protein n=1 Tax=Scandinavium manionii TaxID=2926520 RepID=UPI0021662D19|nr:glycosyltransferase family 2 protein [Scandinavium manionii]MCS2150037.1 glycosyltransferase [Scandinavium manionii]
MMIKISIVTVVYNAVEQISSTIDSVLEQSYSNIEYIVIDGLSKDGTKDEISRYLDNINVYISEKDDGIYDAMNKSLDYVSGDWVLYLNAGDTLLDCFVIEKFVAEIQKMELPIAEMIGGNVMFDVHANKQLSKVKDLSKRWVCMPACHQSLFYRVDVIRANRFNLEFKICSDHEQFIRLVESGARFKPIDLTVSTFQFNGVSAKNRIGLYTEKLKIAKKYNASFLNILKLQTIILRLKISGFIKGFREIN